MKTDNYKAILFGCAIGDALGMPVEGWKQEQIRKYYGRITDLIDPLIVNDEHGNLTMQDEFGKIKYHTKGLKAGQWTDDTILTIALAESIAEIRYINLKDIAQKQLHEFLYYEKSGSNRAFGKTTRDAMNNLARGVFPSGVIGGPGAAPAMKMAPVGIYMDISNEIEDNLKNAEMIGKITHLDPRSVASGVVQAFAIHALLQNVSRDTFVDSITDICSRYEIKVTSEYSCYGMGSLSSRLRWIQNNKDASVEYAFKILGSSSNVLCCYPFTLFMFQKYFEKPLEGMIETVNYGGDCDTTGAIYGTLVGAKYGMIFPEKWISKIENLEKIIAVSKKLERLS